MVDEPWEIAAVVVGGLICMLSSYMLYVVIDYYDSGRHLHYMLMDKLGESNEND